MNPPDLSVPPPNETEVMVFSSSSTCGAELTPLKPLVRNVGAYLTVTGDELVDRCRIAGTTTSDSASLGVDRCEPRGPGVPVNRMVTVSYAVSPGLPLDAMATLCPSAAIGRSGRSRRR